MPGFILNLSPTRLVRSAISSGSLASPARRMTYFAPLGSKAPVISGWRTSLRPEIRPLLLWLNLRVAPVESDGELPIAMPHPL